MKHEIAQLPDLIKRFRHIHISVSGYRPRTRCRRDKEYQAEISRVDISGIEVLIIVGEWHTILKEGKVCWTTKSKGMPTSFRMENPTIEEVNGRLFLEHRTKGYREDLIALA